jgi:hypothetical protein
MNIKSLLFGLLLLIISCKTYTITPNNFQKQIVNSDKSDLKTSEINDSLANANKQFQAYNLEYLTVNDNKGESHKLFNSPSIEVRVTLKNGKRKHFYLDTVILEKDTLKGMYSKILGLTNKVAFDDIIKIQVQDGKKNFGTYKSKEELISEKSHKTFDDNIDKESDYFEFRLDTISIEGSKSESLYYAKCKFENSNTELKILYTKNNEKLELITTQETSPFENDITWMNTFFIENKKIFLNNNFVSKNENNTSKKEILDYTKLKFNKNINTKFLKKFTLDLFDKIEKLNTN